MAEQGFTTPVPIIGPHFCLTDPVVLVMVKEVIPIYVGSYVVKDINRNIIFKVKGTLLTWRDRRVLHDAAGIPIVTFRRKLGTLHDRWKVFRGESTEPSDLLFTVARSTILPQAKAKLCVYLPNNTNEYVCDFRVDEGSESKNCIIYAGNSTKEVAQMNQKQTVRSVLIGKDQFIATVHPNTDHAFIVTLIAIFDSLT